MCIRDRLYRVKGSVKILVPFTPLGRGATMFFLEYPGDIFAIVESRLQGKVKECTIGGHEQMGEILDPVGYDKLIDGGTHRLFKLHLQVATRQRHQLGQAIDIDVAREVVLDKIHHL